MKYLRYWAKLNRHLGPHDTVLPLDKDDFARLALDLPPGETALLVLRDDIGREEVEVAVQGGYPVLVRRGIGETGDHRHLFPRGSVIGFEVTLEMVERVVRDVLAGDACQVDPPTVTASLVPDATVGQSWAASVVFAGDLPMSVGTGPLPSWVQVEAGPNHVRLWGVPPAAGTMAVAVAAANKSGVIAADSKTVVIT